MSPLATKFVQLDTKTKAIFLARVAHEGTIFGRLSYVSTPDHPNRNFANPDAVILRDANNFVHRVVGYISHVLEGTERNGQGESVMEMIEEYFRGRGASHLLGKWLKTSN